MPPIASGDIVLASASPRRRELLALIGVPFRVVVSDFDESSLSSTLDPAEYVERAARGKADEVARRVDGWIIGVDTDVVSPEGAILGKAVDAVDAARMLRLLSGRAHRVFSSLVLLHAAAGTTISVDSQTVVTEVTFTRLSESMISGYLATGEYRDKAGAYGIQGAAMALVERIDGDLSNVIGLPLLALTAMLTARGLPVWQGAESRTSTQGIAGVA